MLFNIHEA